MAWKSNRIGVALLAEGVDRNSSRMKTRRWMAVALLAEGVDRNYASLRGLSPSEVALLAEGVDRNATDDVLVEFRDGRPPRGGRG